MAPTVRHQAGGVDRPRRRRHDRRGRADHRRPPRRRVPALRARGADPTEELRLLGETLGRPLRLVEPSVEEAKAGLRASGMPPAVVDAVIAQTLDTEVGAQVLPGMERLLGRRPSTFAHWVRAHAGAFTGRKTEITPTEESQNQEAR